MEAEIISRHQLMLEPITDHVWFYPPASDSQAVQPGVGVILTDSATVLVDAGNSPRHARQIRADLRQMNAPPIQYIIYTHHHWDHTFGTQIWSGGRVVGHAQCRDLMSERYGSQPWNQRHGPDQEHIDPARSKILSAMDQAVEDWSTFRLVLPHITFHARLDLFVGDLTLSLTHVGGRHATDSIVVQVDGVLFLGDCFYPPPASLRQPEDTVDFDMMQALLTYDTETFIDAHGSSRSRTAFTQLLKDR